MPSLLEMLLKAPASTPPKKHPEKALANNRLLLGGYAPQPPKDTVASLWTPQEQELFLPARTPPALPARPLSLPEQAALVGRAIQSIPETISRVADTIENIPRVIGEVGASFRVLGGSIIRGLDWLERHLPTGPLDPYGRPVPRWNVDLYRLAGRAYRGDWKARATFLNEIEADDSPDNVLLIEPLLEPTFNPRRNDLRVHWEQETPEEARKRLRKLLEGHKQRSPLDANDVKKGEYVYEHSRQALVFDEQDGVIQQVDEQNFYGRLQSTLPEQQLMFCWLRSQGMKYEEIAAEMGIGISSVKTHARQVKNKPNFREMLGQ